MGIYFKLWAILLMPLLVQSNGVSTNDLCTRDSTGNASECGTYCYKVVKQLLSYAASIRSKEEQFAELESKIDEQNAIVFHLKETIRHKDLQLNQQIELTAAYKSNIALLEKQLVSNDGIITSLQSKVKSADSQIAEKDKELKKSQSKHEVNELNVARIKHLEAKLSECKAMSVVSICLGKPSEIYPIKVPDMDPFSVSCDSKYAGSGWIVIQRRINGSVNFNRGWDDYKAGFGDLRGEFFIGLEKLHKLTQSQPHELYISLEDFQNQTRFARYSDFVIGNEAELYKIKMLGDFTGNVADSFNYHKDKNFSTPDKDNDVTTGNCALSYESGWWFYDCYNCNLNGRYTSKDVGITGKRIGWNGWQLKPLKFTQMMIRPKSS
ncbi:uncharacterized protein Dvir_GJ17863 [Drosophila virilis]|uniref:Fibrinogen C-terminal domain-containing protein n=1 Tax=Drosophila virilis TaxID=7244 RepID=B4M9R6_DROVI|nr:ficolin-2 [Drosophila virilis]EDW57942.2 uncharacterized protein Dvir_GJ17863 [Drosophila virilis]